MSTEHSSLEIWLCVCSAPKQTTHKSRVSPTLNIASAGKTSDLKCSMLFICKRLRRVLNSSTIMLTTSTSSEEDPAQSSHSKGKRERRLKRNPREPNRRCASATAGQSQRPQTRTHSSKCARHERSVHVCGSTLYSSPSRADSVARSQTNNTTTACIYTQKISAGREGNTVSRAVCSSPFRGDCDW